MAMNFLQGKLEEVRVVIKNIRKDLRSENEPFVTGVSFADLSESQYEILGGFLKSRASECRGNPRG